MKKCKSCGNVCADDARFCNECGYQFEESVAEEKVEAVVEEEKIEGFEEYKEPVFEEEKPRVVECPVCGAVVDVNVAPNCPVCGALLSNEKPAEKKKEAQAKQTKTYGLANAAFILGIVASSISIFTFTGIMGYLAVIVAIPAIVFGIISLCKKVRGKSLAFAIIGLALAVEAIYTALIMPSIFEELENEFESLEIFVAMLLK